LPVALVFDIDGTLVTFKFDVQGTRRAILMEMASSGFDTQGLGLATPTQGFLDSAKAQASSGGAQADFDAFRARVYEILDGFEVRSVASTSALPGAKEALQRLKANGARLAVLTNSGLRAAREALGRAGLSGYFEFVLTRDDTVSMKPRPEGIASAVSRLGVGPESTYYVGDSPFDIAAAKGAGVRVISVATGNYTVERLRAEGADLAVSSIAEIPSLLGL
jgi:phosphoglycolate phosphatase